MPIIMCENWSDHEKQSSEEFRIEDTYDSILLGTGVAYLVFAP